MVIFTVSGFWHGANWTFIIWGGLHALYFIPLLVAGRNRKNTDIVAQGKMLFSVKEFLQMLLTFGLVTLAWIFFRAPSVADAVLYISGILSPSLFTTPAIFPVDFLIILFLFITVEWFSREKMHPFEFSLDNLRAQKALHTFAPSPFP